MVQFELIAKEHPGSWYGVQYWEDEDSCALVAAFPSLEQANGCTEYYSKVMDGHLVQTVYLDIENIDGFEYILVGADD